jgi:hypothetical protein
MGTTGRSALSWDRRRSAARAPALERALLQQLQDQRSRQVVFLSHCLLNENTRYLGGACRAGCIPELVQQCNAADLGIVQLPCPEQHAWGGAENTAAARPPLHTARLPAYGVSGCSADSRLR